MQLEFLHNQESYQLMEVEIPTSYPKHGNQRCEILPLLRLPQCFLSVLLLSFSDIIPQKVIASVNS